MSAPWRFYGWIAGVGTASGTRLVLGHWITTPLWSFSDIMVAHPDGRRQLLAPSEAVARFVSDTYQFDDVTVAGVEVVRSGQAQWRVAAGPLTWIFRTGVRHPIGWVLRAVPPRLGGGARFATLVDPLARVLLPGVRTIGRAGGPTAPRLEWYAGRDLHRIETSTASWDGTDLGALRPVRPTPRFGFSACPAVPSLTRVVSTVVER